MIESLQNSFFVISLYLTYAYIFYILVNVKYECINPNALYYIYVSGKIVPTNCLWVGNVPMDMKRRELEQAFAHYGKIKSFDFSNGDPIAIVSYNEIEDAIKARAKMTGVTQIVDGRKVRTESGQSDSSRRGKKKSKL